MLIMHQLLQLINGDVILLACQKKQKHTPVLMGPTYGCTGFYSAQTSYFKIKVLTFAKDKNMQSTVNLTLQWPHKLHLICSFWAFYKF